MLFLPERRRRRRIPERDARAPQIKEAACGTAGAARAAGPTSPTRSGPGTQTSSRLALIASATASAT